MMVDTGAQVSLVGTNVLRPETKIDSSKKVQISSIHGIEETLGEVGANIVLKDMQIPINMQVVKDSPVIEDGIIGFDVLKPYAVINGPLEKLTWTKENKEIHMPMNIRYGTLPRMNTLNKVTDTSLPKEDLHNNNTNKPKTDMNSRLNLVSNDNSSLITSNVEEKWNLKPGFSDKDWKYMPDLVNENDNRISRDNKVLKGNKDLYFKDVNCENKGFELRKICRLQSSFLRNGFYNCYEWKAVKLIKSNRKKASRERLKRKFRKVYSLMFKNNNFGKVRKFLKASENKDKNYVNRNVTNAGPVPLLTPNDNFVNVEDKDFSYKYNEKNISCFMLNLDKSIAAKNLMRMCKGKLARRRKVIGPGWKFVKKKKGKVRMWKRFYRPCGDRVAGSNFYWRDWDVLGNDVEYDHGLIYEYLNQVQEIDDCRIEIRPKQANPEFSIIIPPRSIKDSSYPVNASGNVIINSLECVPGVYVAGGLSPVIDGKVFVRMVNVNLYPVRIVNPKIGFELFDDSTPSNTHSIHSLSSEESNEGLMRFHLLTKELNLNENWTSEERELVLELCKEYQNLFLLPGDKLTHTSSIVHAIPTNPNIPPINQRNYRLPNVHKNVIEEHTKDMLESDIIEPSCSPWNSPLIVVPKKSIGGKPNYRVVIDFRKLNAQTTGDAYPLPRIDDILDKLKDARYFTTLDLASGYHQVLVSPEDRPKTAFSTEFGHFEFKRMPFGLKGAPATFQRLMNQVLLGLQGIQCFVYLDDCVVFGKDRADHFTKLRNVMSRLSEANLRLHPKKCFFLRKEIIYLGHHCGVDGCRPDPDKVKVIDGITPPKSLKELQSFLGIINYYRRFVPNFSRVAIPLVNLTKKGVRFEWTEHCQNALDDLKWILKEKIMLKYPDFTQPFQIYTDASNYALGAVLCQNEKPVSFASKTLTATETRYSTIEKELFGVVWAVEHFRPYVYGTRFTVFTDHKPLLGLHKHKDPSSRLLRLYLKLSEFDITLEYKPGNYNQVADGLSRLPVETNSVQINAVTRAQAMKSTAPTNQDKLPTISEVHDQNELNEDPEDTQLDEADKQFLELFYRHSGRIVDIKCSTQVKSILKQFHDSKLGGHLGADKTIEKIKRYFSWPRLSTDVKNYVRSCEICQKSKTTKNTRMKMQQVEVSKYPFQKIFLDIVGPIEVSNRGNRYILTVLDDHSRYFNAYPLPNQESATLCYVFVTSILSHHKTPKILITDNGSNFMSTEFNKVCKLFGIKKYSTSSYHPESNGGLERAHRSLGQYLRSFANGNPRIWDDLLTYATYVHNNSVNRSTKLAPNDILYGYISEMPVKHKKNIEPQYNFDSEFSNVYHSIYKVWAWAKENQEKAREISKAYYDRDAREVFFEKGDKVFLRNEARRGKFAFLWSGPYEVVNPSGRVNTVIQVKKKKCTVHNNRLKKYNVARSIEETTL